MLMRGQTEAAAVPGLDEKNVNEPKTPSSCLMMKLGIGK